MNRSCSVLSSSSIGCTAGSLSRYERTARTSVVYGVIERTAVAAGTVLGVTGAWLARALPALDPLPPAGAHGLGAVVDPALFLAELASRGVKAAAFEGVAVA